MNLFAALVNPNATSTNTMGRRHPNHRVSGLVQRNVCRKTCGLIWGGATNLGIKFLRKALWSGLATNVLHVLKTPAKSGEVQNWLMTQSQFDV